VNDKAIAQSFEKSNTNADFQAIGLIQKPLFGMKAM